MFVCLWARGASRWSSFAAQILNVCFIVISFSSSLEGQMRGKPTRFPIYYFVKRANEHMYTDEPLLSLL